MELIKGREYKVISPSAPFCGKIVTFESIEVGSKFPIVCRTTVDGEEYPACYASGELESVDDSSTTGPIPVVVA